jgi:hypothetical protein
MEVSDSPFSYELGITQLRGILTKGWVENFNFGRIVDQMFESLNDETVNNVKISQSLDGEKSPKQIGRLRNYFRCCRVIQRILGEIVYPVFTFTRNLSEADAEIFALFIKQSKIDLSEKSVPVCVIFPDFCRF